MTLRQPLLRLLGLATLAWPGFAAEPTASPAPSAAVARPAFREALGKLKAGETLPDFDVQLPDGSLVKFADYTAGRTVVLDFWATWCGPCQEAMPHLDKVSRDYAGRGVMVVGICSFDTREAYDGWLKTNREKYSFPTVFDPIGKPEKGNREQLGQTIMAKLSKGLISPLPTTAVIDASGKLVGSYVGYSPATEAALDELLTRALQAPIAAAVIAPASQPAPSAVASDPATAAAPRGVLQPGALAPDFVMLDVEGREVRLSDFSGKVVVLDFWATWCGPCLVAMPHTQDLAAKYRDQDVVVVAAGTSDTIARFKSWIPENQATYPDIRFTFDPNERDSATFAQRASASLYRVAGIPTQFVIGRDGKIVGTILGNQGATDARTEASLARAGVQVDATIVALGQAQFDAEADAEIARAKEAEVESKKSLPKFRESYGKTNNGAVLPEFTAIDGAGETVSSRELSQGKVMVLQVFGAANALTAETLAVHNAWASRYADQDVVFVGLASYGMREDFDRWFQATGKDAVFPVLFDPIGKLVRPKPQEEMSEDEKAAYKVQTAEYYANVIPMRLAGGMMAPLPHSVVVDASGQVVGFFTGALPVSADSLGNLLLRAGVKLREEDMPTKVFTAAETKPAPPPERVALLEVGAMAPDFPASDLNGREVKLSDYRGKVVILDFWATWCGPCIASMPHTQEVAAQYKDQGVVVLASCTSDRRSLFDAWVKRYQRLYPDIQFSHDPQERSPERASFKL